jgi:hypothetical protein
MARKSDFCYIQGGVDCLSKPNRLGIGKALPVFLAILFLGASDSSLRTPALAETGSSQNASGQLAGSSAALSRTRCAALYLLPALISQARGGLSSPAGFLTLPASGAQAGEVARLGSAPAFALALSIDSFRAHTLWQRPPPSV